MKIHLKTVASTNTVFEYDTDMDKIVWSRVYLSSDSEDYNENYKDIGFGESNHSCKYIDHGRYLLSSFDEIFVIGMAKRAEYLLDCKIIGPTFSSTLNEHIIVIYPNSDVDKSIFNFYFQVK